LVNLIDEIGLGLWIIMKEEDGRRGGIRKKRRRGCSSAMVIFCPETTEPSQFYPIRGNAAE